MKLNNTVFAVLFYILTFISVARIVPLTANL